jgi:hypothetical protein
MKRTDGIFSLARALGILIVLTFTAGCSTTNRPLEGKEMAISVAKQEVERLGWKRFRVVGCEFLGNRWVVSVVGVPHYVGHDGVIQISPEGEVMSAVLSRY